MTATPPGSPQKPLTWSTTPFLQHRPASKTPPPPEPRCAVGAGSLLQAQHTASPWSRHSPRALVDVCPFKTLLLLLLPQPHGVGFQPRRSRLFASPAQEKEQHWGEWDVPAATPTPGRSTAPAPHHCPLSPFAILKGASYTLP